MNEDEYKEMLYRKTRERAEAIRNGSYKDMPWAPHKDLVKLWRDK